MAALGDMAVFGRRINVGPDGLALTRPLLILIYSGFRDQSFPGTFGAFDGTTGEKPGNNIGGELLVRGAVNDVGGVFDRFP
jgi:hypothetical protein